MGKLPAAELQRLINCIRKDPRVLVPPKAGYDAGVHLLGDEYVVVATDPCIGVPTESFGWLLVNFAASDVALFGSKPQFCTITLLGPPLTKAKKFIKIMKQACTAADELGIAIVRGHTGTYEGLTSLVGVCTAYGTVEKDKLITPNKAKAGDLILCTKSIGLETLVNISLTNKAKARQLFGIEATERFAQSIEAESCVKEALKLAETTGVHTMHDATEGGFTAALNEISEAAQIGFRIRWEDLPISPEARALQSYFKLSDEQLLSLSSTGMVIVAVNPADKEKITITLSQMGIPASYVGEFTKSKKRILVKKGKKTSFALAANDPYDIVLSGKGNP